MNANNMAEAGKKKFLVPVVVLLLCGVAMAGAGYAYTSQLDNGTITGTDATYFQIALNEDGKATYEATSTGTVEFNQVYDAKAKTSTFKTAGNTIGTFETKLDDARSNNASDYQIEKVTVTCVEDSALKFTVELGEDGHSFTVSIAAGQVPTTNPGKETTYTLNISILANAVASE